MIYTIVPCYNAEHSISELLRALSAYVSLDQVICVNDGSTDNTRSILESAQTLSYHFSENQGKGRCLRQGFELALSHSASQVLTIDCDMQHDPREIPKFIKSSSDFDIVIGSRRDHSNRFSSPMPINRRFSNTITSAWLSNLCRQPILDSQCGYRLISAQCIREILPLCKETGFMFETEFLIHAAKRGHRIGFVGIETIYTSAKSHMRYATDTLNFIKLMIQHRFTKSKAFIENSPEKVVSP